MLPHYPTYQSATSQSNPSKRHIRRAGDDGIPVRNPFGHSPQNARIRTPVATAIW